MRYSEIKSINELNIPPNLGHLIKENEAKLFGLKDNAIEVENSKTEYKILKRGIQ